MESKEQLFEKIKTINKEDYVYLEKMMAHCPDEVIESMRILNIPKAYHLIEAGEVCDYVYIILRGKEIGRASCRERVYVLV